MQNKTVHLINLFVLIMSTPVLGSNSGCAKQLKTQKWPIDCLIDLNLKKLPPQSPHYTKMDRWCSFFKEELSSLEPPEAFFSLYSPPACKNIAQKKRRELKALQIVNGDFLNSFL